MPGRFQVLQKTVAAESLLPFPSLSTFRSTYKAVHPPSLLQAMASFFKKLKDEVQDLLKDDSEKDKNKEKDKDKQKDTGDGSERGKTLPFGETLLFLPTQKSMKDHVELTRPSAP